ncbi:hypothetical protein K8I28_10070 [bacterium]|nr:hypothetical protein [bacterium]
MRIPPNFRSATSEDVAVRWVARGLKLIYSEFTLSKEPVYMKKIILLINHRETLSEYSLKPGDE